MKYLDNVNQSSISLKDSINLIRNNLTPVIIILAVCLISSIIFAIQSKDIYKSTTSLKISKPKGNILETSLMPDVQDFSNDRFLSTEIEIMKSRSVRLKVAQALLDSVKKIGSPESFYIVTSHTFNTEPKNNKLLSVAEIASNLEVIVDIEQKRGMDIVEISVETPSPFGSAISANIYANEYRLFNLEVNRNQLSSVRDFLHNQVRDKQQELRESENNLTSFQAQKGIISLDAQAQSLISQLADFEAQRDGIKIEMASTDKMLEQLKKELNNQDPKITTYIENLANQSYFKILQDEIAKLQVNKDIVRSNKSGNDNSAVIKQYDNQISELRKKLNEKTKVIKEGFFSSNPEAINDITVKILDSEVKIKGLTSQLAQINNVVNKYEQQFNKLPETSINYAQLQRKREASEKLFSILEEKFQEALINEQSQPGNVFIIDNAIESYYPSKPNRLIIILAGFFVGIVISFSFVVVQSFLDNRIKSPEELEKRNISILAWVPIAEELGKNGRRTNEFIIHEKPDALFSEAFKALRTRVLFSRPDSENLKKILITSAVPQEGKTTISVNLAGAFAQDGKKTLIIDADFRKPRVHNVFNQIKTPGLVDYLFDRATLEEIIRQTPLENLSYIPCGTIPHNPSELVGSNRMKQFLVTISEKFDVVIIDSAPIIAVTDSEILSRMVDATLLVVSADSTEMALMEKAIQLIKNDSSSFIGTVLNKFTFKAGYGSYYKYYYYYNDKTKEKKNLKL